MNCMYECTDPSNRTATDKRMIERMTTNLKRLESEKRDMLSLLVEQPLPSSKPISRGFSNTDLAHIAHATLIGLRTAAGDLEWEP